MIKILKTPQWCDVKTFFDINNQPYKLVGQDHDLALDFIDGDSKPKLILDIWHNFENQTRRYDQWLEHDQVHIVTNVVSKNYNISDGNKKNRINFVDFLFNRTKAFYSDFQFGPDTVPWYWAGKGCYFIDDLDIPQIKTKLFVSPTFTYDGTKKYRQKLHEHLKNYQDKGWLSSPYLFSNLDAGIDDCSAQPATMRRGYNPIHQDYYRRSFVSIYGETVEYGDDICVTEKTFDPLIKGHFILPFSNQGFISYLKSIGIEFPAFIDYSYDCYHDDDMRYRAYAQEIDRLLSLPFDVWNQQWIENLDLRKKNQIWFDLKDYERIDLHQILTRTARRVS